MFVDDVVGPGVHHVTRRDVSWMKHGNLGASYRPGHPGNREYVIETLVVADKKMAEYHRTDENLMHYILTLMSHVNIYIYIHILLLLCTLLLNYSTRWLYCTRMLQ